MTTHVEDKPTVVRKLHVLDGGHPREVTSRVLEVYDATSLVGLRTVVYRAAIETEENGEVTVELPKLRELLASAAVVRCMTPIRLRGPEIRAIRRIMKLTLAELAKKLDDRTAVETVSRWESGDQPMGTYAEKVFRLIVCEELKAEAFGIEYQASWLVDFSILDPWKSNPSYEVPPIELELVRIKERSGTIIETWDARAA